MKRETIEKANKILEKMEGTKMIKLKDIAEKYGEYELDEDKLKEILIEPKTVWDIKENDYYYFLDSRGCIGVDTWRNYDEDYERAGIANIFLTREDAEFERERLKVEAELLKYGGTRDMMSLGDENTKKWFMKCIHKQSPLLNIDSYWTVNIQGVIYFKSQEAILNAIAKIGEDRIKKYIFNVKE